MHQKIWHESPAMDPDEVKRLCREWEMHPRVAEIIAQRPQNKQRDKIFFTAQS